MGILKTVRHCDKRLAPVQGLQFLRTVTVPGTLELDGIAQLDWTADQMAKQTEIQYLLDEENEEQAESEDASVENAELSE